MYQPPQYQQQQQQAAAAPAVTQNPVSASAQAYFTSYASRLRTGATLLVQPTIFPGGTYTSSTRATRASRRSRTTINYAEPDDDDDDENDKNEAADPDHVPDAGALDDDANDGDFNAGRAGRGAGRPSSRNVNADQTLAVDGAELDQSYLGKVPPSKFIKSRGILDYGPNYGSETTNDQKATTSPPILIPVRVEFDVPESGLRIRDVFLWNLHENDDASGITPEIFAAQFCRDLDIAVDPYAEMVSRQMRAQVEDARGEAWLEQEMDLDLDGETSPQINPECRVILSIDVQIATYHLTDHIEWDLLSPLTPEVFSIQLCKDLGLTGEAVPLIAHAVHEELCRHRKDVVEWGVVALSNAWNDKNPNRGDEIARDRTGLGLGSLGRPSRERDGRYPKALKSAWRDWVEAEEYATRWEELSPEEVERREIERERAGRRLRRETSKWRTRR
ncbi:SNF5-domain-containing protein [Lentinula raphanica]|nr:SNF5-domain-containing protein [Lentinula raphanica]